MRAIALALLLLLVPVLGCLSGDDATSAQDEAITRARAQVTADTATIAGVVTDTAVSPVEGVNITVLELDETTRTRSDGTFVIGPIPPGTYTLTARVPGFVPAQEEVRAPAGKVASVDFILAHLATNLPFIQEFEMAGFMEWSWGLGFNTSLDGASVRDTNCDYDATAGPLCRGDFDLEPPLESLVFEMVWEPTSPLADEFQVMLRVRDNASIITGDWALKIVEGPSPLTFHMDRAELDERLAGFAERCADGEDQFCGLGFRDQGWPMQTRTWASWHCPTTTAGFCVAFQQPYTQYVTAFYNQPAPDGYSILGP